MSSGDLQNVDAITPKFCINCSNLHSGGAVQVAASFLTELSSLDEVAHLGRDIDLSIIVSTVVADNLSESVLKDIRAKYKLEVTDVFGLHALRRKHIKRFKGYDLVFTIFGPDYLRSLNCIRIVGFAQPWIIYPNNEVYSKLNVAKRIKLKLKYYLQSLFFRQADYAVVEAPHVKERLIQLNLFNTGAVAVVPNTVSDVFRNSKKFDFNRLSQTGNCDLKFGLVSRGYAHKNIEYIGIALSQLELDHGIKAKCYVTLTQDEFSQLPHETRKWYENIGPIKVEECPSFYQKIDAVIFPSLLECFSATPLEALVAGKRLFASNRPFVKDVCGSYALYFDPLDPSTLVSLILEYISSDLEADLAVRIDAAAFAKEYSFPKGRAVRYLELMAYVYSEKAHEG